MGTYTVYDAAAVNSTIQESLVKESVGDLITNLFPLDTPLQQILEKVPMQHVYHQQPVDTFTGITRTSAVLATGSSPTQLQRGEGATYTSSTPQYPKRLISCVAEIQGIQFSVSDTDRAMSQYGMVDRYAYEALKTTETVVNNFEHSFWWSPGSPPQGKDFDTDGGDVVVARQTQGLVHWICKTGLERSVVGLTANSFQDEHGNEFGDGGGANPTALTNAMSWAYNAGGLVLDDTMFKDNLMAQWYSLTGRQAGAVGFCGAKIKNLISRFALTANGPVNDRTLAAAAKRIVDTVDYYETDFGVVSINLCRYLNIAGQSVAVTQSSSASVTIPYDEVLLFIQPEYFKIGVVRPIYMSAIAKTGDFESGLVRGEMGLMCRNPQAGAAIVNCVS